MHNRENVAELILKWGEDGNEILIEEVAKIEGAFNVEEIKDKLVKNSVMQRARSLVHRVYASQGKKIRSVRKNVYRVVDENNINDCNDELKRLTRATDRHQKKLNDFKELMVKKGHHVQIVMTVVTVEGGEFDGKDEKTTQIRSVNRTSQKPKKASNG